jgi:choline dehydrogenase-like flavoprotein
VVLVEAGAWRDPEHYPSSAYGGMRDMMPDWGAAVTAGRAQWPIVQGRGVGGTTLVNSAIAVRTPADVFARWAREHGFGGEALAQRLWAIQEDHERQLGAEVPSPAATGRNNALALQGATALGYDNHVTTRFVRGCTGAGQCLQGCRTARKQSLNLNFVPETLQRGGTVLSCAPVDRVTLEGNRAVGVTGRFLDPGDRRRGARFAVRARNGVVVAASVLHSPLILLRSGVRSRSLGRGFRCHPGTAILGVYDEPVDMNAGATQGWASMAFREDPGFKLETLSIPLELVASRLKGAGSALMARIAEFRHLALWVMAVRAETVGSLRRGPWGPWVSYTLDEADMRRMRTAAALLARTHFAAGARAVISGVHGMPYRIGPDEVGLLEQASLDPRAWVGILSHLFGGCTMGADPATSVCDPAGRVHGYTGLHVADASLIPTNLGVNPQHTIMALARQVAEDGLES